MPETSKTDMTSRSLPLQHVYSTFHQHSTPKGNVDHSC